MKNDDTISRGKQGDSSYFSHIISEKLKTYTNSPLTVFHDHLLKIFFDLAQQHNGLLTIFNDDVRGIICNYIGLQQIKNIHKGLTEAQNTRRMICFR